MIRIPQNRIAKQNNYGDSYGDVIESFNLDLTQNYGAFRTTRMKKVTDSVTESDLEIAVGFAYYGGDYYAVTDDYVYRGGSSPSDAFVKVTGSGAPNGQTVEALSDIEIFNNAMYVSGNDEIMKLSGSTWSTPVSTQLSANRPHLLKAFGTGDNARLYVTDEFYKVHSVSTADAISATGSYTLDLKLNNNWTITMLESAENSLWVGLQNTEDGSGMVVEWDGATENIVNRQFMLENGVIAGTVLSDTPYIVDTRGRLLKFDNVGFSEVDRFNLKEPYLLNGANSGTNLRFIHPNGITVTDYGSILILFSNEAEGQVLSETSVPSGVYEYHPLTGLYHKYSLSVSPINATTYTDYGMHQSSAGNMGAILFRRSFSPDADTNGTLLVGAEYETQTGTTRFGIFCDDSLQTTPTMGSFTSPWLFSDKIDDVWQKVYSIYRKFQHTSDKIVVKYRTIEKNSDATCNWLTSTSFTTTTDVSDFEQGDEVTILNGNGAGQVMRIKEIQASSTVYTVTVHDNEFSATLPFKARFQNFKSLTTIDDNKQFNAQTITNNTEPCIQFKVYMYFTGRQELHKLLIVNKNNTRE